MEICSLFDKSSMQHSCCLKVGHEGLHRCNSPQHMCKMMCSLPSCKNICVIKLSLGIMKNMLIMRDIVLKNASWRVSPKLCLQISLPRIDKWWWSLIISLSHQTFKLLAFQEMLPFSLFFNNLWIFQMTKKNVFHLLLKKARLHQNWAQSLQVRCCHVFLVEHFVGYRFRRCPWFTGEPYILWLADSLCCILQCCAWQFFF